MLLVPLCVTGGWLWPAAASLPKPPRAVRCLGAAHDAVGSRVTYHHHHTKGRGQQSGRRRAHTHAQLPGGGRSKHLNPIRAHPYWAGAPQTCRAHARGWLFVKGCMAPRAAPSLSCGDGDGVSRRAGVSNWQLAPASSGLLHAARMLLPPYHTPPPTEVRRAGFRAGRLMGALRRKGFGPGCLHHALTCVQRYLGPKGSFLALTSCLVTAQLRECLGDQTRRCAASRPPTACAQGA